MVPWLDDFHKAMTQVGGVQNQLGTLARAFDITGNTVMAEELYAMQTALHIANRNATNAVHGNIHRQSKDATDAIGTTLKALLEATE